MCETVGGFDTQLTNCLKYWNSNQKTAKMRFYQSWQGHLSNSRTNDMHDLLVFGKNVKFF